MKRFSNHITRGYACQNRPMNLREMEVFRAVMLTGGVGGAAQLLHVSQPAISKVLAQAQKQAGFALFERVKGRLLPTPEGQQLHQEIDALWRGVERVRDVSRSLAAPRTGTLRLAVSASLASYLVPRTIALLCSRFPGLKSHMDILIAPIMVEALLDNTVDLGVALQPNDHPTCSPCRTGAARLPASCPRSTRWRALKPCARRTCVATASSPRARTHPTARRCCAPTAAKRTAWHWI